jgi:pyruvate/2-oxoglutarate dehydrogenase complex dihydrolipoamide dehydrogenase (E3) component
MASYDYDVIVIGSGAGGIVCAKLLAKAGKSIAVVESEKLGGHNLHHGALPRAAMLESANLYYTARNSDRFGLRGSGVGFNYPRINAWKNLAIKQTGVNESEKSLNTAGISVIRGAAHFIDHETITVGRARFKAKKFIVASGGTPAKLHVPGLLSEDFLDSKEALELTRPPKTLAIIGGGKVGVELATIFGSFGSKVCLIEKSSHLLSSEDPLAGKSISANLNKLYGVKVIEKATLQSGARRGRKKQLILKVAGKLHALVVDEAIMAVGKDPNTDIGLENARIEYDKNGIKTNYHLLTTNKNIYAIGDVVSGHRSAHSSIYQARLAAHNLLKAKRQITLDYVAMPRVVEGLSEVASVGLSASQLSEEKIKTKSAITDINLVAKSSISLPKNGFVKLTADSKTGIIVSACIVAPHASEMISEITLAIKNKLKASDLAQVIHPLPTWSEAIRVTATKLANS